MRIKVKHVLLGLSAGAFLFGCSSDKSSKLVGSKAAEPQIGEGYNSYTDTYTNTSCISTSSDNIIFTPPRIGSVIYKQDSGFEELIDLMSGGGSADLSLESVSASGSIDFVNNNRASTYSATYVLAIDQQAGSYSLDYQSLPTLNDYGKYLVGHEVDDAGKEIPRASALEMTEACGTGFVSGKRLMANFVAVMKFEFANETDKDKFQGQLAIAASDFDIAGELKVALENVSEKASISLSVYQMGGNATALPKVLGGSSDEDPDVSGELEEQNDRAYDILECSAKDKTKCLDAWENVIDYAVNNFPSQFAKADGSLDPDRFITVDYDYSPYTMAYPGWNGKKPTEDVLQTINAHRTTLGLRYLEEEAALNRARLLLDSGLISDANERAKVIEIADVIANRIDVILSSGRYCYDIVDDSAQCEKAIQDTKRQLASDVADNGNQISYDPTALAIIPQNFLDWCEKFKTWYHVRNENGYAIANTVLGPEARHTFQKIVELLLGIEIDISSVEEGQEPPANSPASLVCESLSAQAGRITELVLSDSYIFNVEPIASLPYLNKVVLSNNYISDTLPLAKLKFLEELDLNKARVGNLTGLGSSKVRNLNLSNNGLIADDIMWSLSGAKYLKDLNLNANEYLDSLEGLENLPRLETLFIDGTEVPVDFDSLQSLKDKFPKLGTVFTATCPVPLPDNFEVFCF